MKLKAVLVPPLFDEKGIPLAAGLLKAYAESLPSLRDRVDIVILEHCGRLEGIAEEILRESPALVGFSVYADMGRVRSVCARLKKRVPEIKIVVGGAYIEAMQFEEIFQDSVVDFAAFGEGEVTFSELLLSLLDDLPFSGVAGLAFRDKNSVRVNPPRPPLRDLNLLPSPFLNRVFRSREYEIAYFEGARGCVYGCRYCTLVGKLRKFSFDRMLRDVEAMLEQFPKLKGFFLTDSDVFFTDQKERLLEIFAAIGKSRGVGLELETNLVHWNPGTFRHLNSLNFTVRAGVQSINPSACKAADRALDFEKLDRSVRLFRAEAPRAKLGLSFIRGLPGDTLEGFRDSLDWALSTGAGPSVFHLHIFPNTYFGKNAKELGIVAQPREPYHVIATDPFPRADLEAATALTRRLGFSANLMMPGQAAGIAMRFLARHLKDRVPRPFLSLCETWSDRLRKNGELARVVAEHDRLMDACSPHYDWEALNNCDLQPHQDVILRDLRDFGEEVLRVHGEEGALPVLDRFVRLARNRHLWMRLDGGKLNGIVSQMGPGGAHRERMMLFGLAELQDQFRIFSGRGSIFLVMDRLCGARGAVDFGAGLPIEKIATVEELPMWTGLDHGDASGKSFRRVVLSHVYGHMPASERIPFLKRLRLRTDPQGGVILIDDLLGYPRFDAAGELLPLSFGDDLSEDAVAGELEEAGWSVKKRLTLRPWSIICAS